MSFAARFATMGLSALTQHFCPPVYYLTPSANCSGYPPVLDPYNAKAGPVCNGTSPQNCAVGDLWGKHGKMVGPNYNTQYGDTLQQDPSLMWKRLTWA